MSFAKKVIDGYVKVCDMLSACVGAYVAPCTPCRPPTCHLFLLGEIVSLVWISSRPEIHFSSWFLALARKQQPGAESASHAAFMLNTANNILGNIPLSACSVKNVLNY